MAVCDNCDYYEWKQEEDKSSMQCSKCKVMLYCSKQCQKEHWFNVHKYQCKYLAKQKVYPHSVHIITSCPDCIEEAETGPVEMCRPENPVLGCPLAILILSDNLHFSLGEMSGQFLNKTDATLSLMLRIMYKMKVTRHTSWVTDQKSTVDICEKICKIRSECWDVTHVYGNLGPKLNRIVALKVHGVMSEVVDHLVTIDTKLHSINFIDESKFRPWDTLILLFSFLELNIVEQNRNRTEIMGLPEMSADLFKLRLPSAQFHSVWQQILDTLHGRLVPYITLVEVMCGGNLRQACYGCLKEVTVMDVIVPDLIFIRNLCPVLVFGNVRAVLCEGPMCAEEIKEELNAHDSDLRDLYTRGFFECIALLCDHCGLPGSRGNMGHRCSRCLTKVYCGEECRNQDWVVHKMVCREGEEERKIKGEQLVRRRKGGRGGEKDQRRTAS